MSKEKMLKADAKNAHAEMGVILEKYTATKRADVPEVAKTVPTPATRTIESLTNFMDKLEENMDLQRGILRSTQPNSLAHIGADREKQKSDVIIRDAREQSAEQAAKKPEDTSESWVIAAAARTRGALKLIDMANGSRDNRVKAQNDAWMILEGYRTKLEKSAGPKERHKMIMEMDYELTHVLKSNGLQIGTVDLRRSSENSVEKMLMDARDACNFERPNHPSIVTITSNLAPDGSLQMVNQVIAAIPTTPCADRGKYFGPTMEQQEWYTALTTSGKDVDKVRAALAVGYKDKIADGQHVTPTQLRFLPGTANTYVQDVSYIINDTHDQTKGFVALRTGVPLHGRGDNANIEGLTQDNTSHIDSIVGVGKNNGTYVCLNSDLAQELGPVAGAAIKAAFGQKEEQAITDGMRRAVEKGRFESCPISVTTKNKAQALKKATDILLDGESITSTFYTVKERAKKFERMNTVFCKSGKDRTQAALEEAGLRDAHQVVGEVLYKMQGKELSNEQEVAISLNVMQASHGAALAGGNGSSRGSFGTKISNVYGKEGIGPLGMPLNQGLILDVRDIATSTISEVTKVEGKKPKHPVLQELLAAASLQAVLDSPAVVLAAAQALHESYPRERVVQISPHERSQRQIKNTHSIPVK